MILIDQITENDEKLLLWQKGTPKIPDDQKRLNITKIQS